MVAHAEVCIYQNSKQEVVRVESKTKVPWKYRDQAVCEGEANRKLDSPENIELSGNQREENISTSMGRVSLRWTRDVEKLFGRTPVRALADATRTANRFLKQAGFKNDVRNLELDWQVVIMNEKLPIKQIPTRLVNRCHPGWMLPPAKVYIVAERVVNGCSGDKLKPGYVADADLMEVLLHEIGHVVEFQLLKNRQNQRQWAEGFASWFEMEAANYSSLIKKGAIEEKHYRLAKRSLLEQPNNFYFQGSAYDYARSSMYYKAITEKTSISKLMDIYDLMIAGSSFPVAVEERLGWSDKKWNQEVKSLLAKH